VSDNDDEDEGDREDCVSTGDRGNDGGWILLEMVGVDKWWLCPFWLRVESRRATEGRFHNSLIEETLRIGLCVAGNSIYALENGMYAAKIARTTTEKII
jgi:hypothetical protein